MISVPGKMTARTAATLTALAVAVAVLDAVTLLPGWWPATFLVAAVTSALVRGGRTLIVVLVATVLAWSVVMLAQSGGRTGDVADLVGALALDTRGMGWLVVVLTVAEAVLLAAAGAWLGAAIRRLVVAVRTPGPSGRPADDAEPEPTATAKESEEAEHV